MDTSRDELGWYVEDGVRRSSRKKVDHNLPEAIDDPMENSLPDGGQSQGTFSLPFHDDRLRCRRVHFAFQMRVTKWIDKVNRVCLG